MNALILIVTHKSLMWLSVVCSHWPKASHMQSINHVWSVLLFNLMSRFAQVRPTHVANPSLSWLLLMCVLPPSAPTEISCGWQSSCQSHEQVGFVHSGRSTFLLWLCISLSAKSLRTFVPADISPSAISNLLPGLDLGCKNVRIFTDYQ